MDKNTKRLMNFISLFALIMLACAFWVSAQSQIYAVGYTSINNISIFNIDGSLKNNVAMSNHPTFVAINRDGSLIVIGDSGNQLRYSKDGGSSFVTTNSTLGEIYKASITKDRIYIGGGFVATKAHIAISNISTISFYNNTVDNSRNALADSVCSAYNGQYVYVVTSVGTTLPKLFRSTNDGINFTEVSGVSITSGSVCAVSDDGKYVYINGYKSSDYGSSFSAFTTKTISDVSSDGQKILGSDVGTGNVYKSNDYGASYSTIDSGTVINDISLSSDGNSYYYNKGALLYYVTNSNTPILVQNLSSAIQSISSTDGVIVQAQNYTITPFGDNHITASDGTDTWYPNNAGQFNGINLNDLVNIFASYTVNASSNLYVAYDCNFSSKTLDNITFSGCVNMTACGWSSDKFNLTQPNLGEVPSMGLYVDTPTSTYKHLTFNTVNNTIYNPQAQEISFKVYPSSTNGLFGIFIKDNYLDDMASIGIETNGSNQCFYILNQSGISNPKKDLIMCMNELHAYNVRMVLSQETLTYTISIFDSQGVEHDTRSISMLNNVLGIDGVAEIYITSYDSGLTASIDNIENKQIINGFPNMQSRTIPYTFSCDYGRQYNKDFTIRVYGSQYIDGFSSYKDLKIHTSTSYVDAQNTNQANDIVNEGSYLSIFPNAQKLSGSTKLFYVLLTLFLTVLLIMGMSIFGSISAGSQTVISIGAFLTTILVIVELIFFVAIDYMSVIWLIIMLVFGAVVVALFLRNKLFTPGGNGGNSV